MRFSQNLFILLIFSSIFQLFLFKSSNFPYEFRQFVVIPLLFCLEQNPGSSLFDRRLTFFDRERFLTILRHEKKTHKQGSLFGTTRVYKDPLDERTIRCSYPYVVAVRGAV